MRDGDMTLSLFALQILNGVESGLLLFLVASGLTLIFGVLGVLNFAHGAFYMLGAYVAYWISARTGSFLAAVLVGLPVMVGLGWLIEKLAISRLYARDHLAQVLLTYGLVLVLNDLSRALFGSDVHGVATPAALSGTVALGEAQTWPLYRAFTSLACLGVAVAIRQVLLHTRFGMRVRAGAVNGEMVEALGIDVRRLLSILFAAGAGLAALAGMLAAPLTTVYPGMGDGVLIVSFVVVVIGGIGSVKGAFLGAMLVGLADVFGKVLLPGLFGAIVYAVMAAVLLFRPRGLFGEPAEAR
jgi:branched-chain amino acid transport system permease protein